MNGMSKVNNFKNLDELIHSRAKEFVLDSDIVLSDGEESQYLEGIKLDVDDMAIDGNDHTIDAQGKARIFHCTGKNITIKNISLKNGFTQKIWWSNIQQCELTITESTLTENTAQENGGAIYNNGGDSTITESTLSGNTAQENGGAIFLNKSRKYESNHFNFKDNMQGDVYEKER